MSARVVECVPNISEGRDRDVIDQVVKAAGGVQGARVLDVDPGAATNRTVITIAGRPEAVSEAAFRLVAKAAELIDMRKHHGEHPRHGATDVCPFVPVSGVTMEDCAELARALGARVGGELGIPVYLYEFAATRPGRVKLPDIREGEYEALPDKLGRPEWEPDSGPNEWNEKVARTGVCTIGARNFLIAYNVNLNSRDASIARDIGLTIRDTGRHLRDANWKFVRGEDGEKIFVPGLLQCCKATGWYIEEYRTAQVTMNLTDIGVTPLHAGYEAVRSEAEKLGVRVTGSEIVGLVPLSAMLDAGRYYVEKQNEGLSSSGRQALTTGIPDARLIEVAVRSLGLSEVAPFRPEEKIIEYMLGDGGVNLSGMTCRDFADELSTDSPAPGGGSAAALMGALGASLDAMVANLTVKNRQYRESWDLMRELAPAAQLLKSDLLRAIDEDTEAFNAWMEAARAGTGVQEAVKGAILVPLGVLERCSRIVELAATLEERGMQASISDAGVAVAAARAAATGAFLNVLINLPQVEGDEGFVASTRLRAEQVLAGVTAAADVVLDRIAAKLAAGLEG